MASKALATTAFLLSLNLLFFTLVSSTKCPPPPPKSPEHSPPPPPSKSPEHSPPPAKSPEHSPPPPKSPEHSPPPSPSSGKCPTDTLKLGVCATLLDSLLHGVVGTPPKTPCCSLLGGLVDLEAAVCLCTALKANILGINLNASISLSLLLNHCGKGVPAGFQCP